MSQRDIDLRLAQAYTTLICSFPFFATVLLRLDRREDTTCDTMWTDGKYLGYNPKFVQELSRDELVGVLAHEVLHVAALHPYRQGARDNSAWNIACDKVVNALVEESKLVLPKGRIPGVADKSAEELYNDPDPSGGGKGKGQGQGQGKGQGQPQPGQGQGSGQSSNDPGGSGEVRQPKHEDGSALSDAEREQRQQETRIMVQQALNAAKRAGKLPAGLERFAGDMVEPKTPWREILSQFVDSHSKHDYSWTHPNRRYIMQGLIMPGMHSPAYGNVAFAPDTSGSMGNEILREVASEIFGALEIYQERGQDPELHVLWWDTKVYPQTIQPDDDFCELRPKGGGGTDTEELMRHVRELEEAPKALIVPTDGHIGGYGEDPGIPVLWILTETNPHFKPPFGELTSILHT